MHAFFLLSYTRAIAIHSIAILCPHNLRFEYPMVTSFGRKVKRNKGIILQTNGFEMSRSINFEHAIKLINLS